MRRIVSFQLSMIWTILTVLTVIKIEKKEQPTRTAAKFTQLSSMQYYCLLQLQYTIIITKALNHLYKLTNPLQITIIFNLYTDAFLQ